jgi:Foie gras liver health family 1.
MKKYLVIQMAEEYLTSRDYGKALTLMSHMLGDYRTDHWSRLVSDIVKPGLYCAMVTASVREYLALSLDSGKLLGSITTRGGFYPKKKKINRILCGQLLLYLPCLKTSIASA